MEDEALQSLRWLWGFVVWLVSIRKVPNKYGFFGDLPTLLVLCAGCVGGRGQTEADGESGRSPSIRFAIEVRRDGPAPIYVLLNGEDGQPGWIQVSSPTERVYFRERCEIEDCARRGVVCGAAVAMVQLISNTWRAGMIEYIWNGMTSVVDPVTGCETRQPAPSGDYVARFCYAHEAEFDVGEDPTRGLAGHLVGPLCTDLPFTLGDQEVVLRI